MDRYQLRYFLAVVDAGNFSRAAARVNVAQPTLSVAIAKLEASLGARLFHRSSQRVHLTEAGTRLLDHARRIESEFNLAERDVAGPRPTRLLRLGVLATIAAGLVERLVERRAAGEGEALEIVEGGERDLIARLERGRIDAALTVLRPDSRNYGREGLFREPYLLALPARHRLAGEKSVAAEALSEEAMILRRQCEALPETSRHFTARGVRPRFSFRTTSDERALAMVRAGLGVTVMPEGLPAEGVVRPALAGFGLSREIGLLFPPAFDEEARAASPTIRAARELPG